MKINGFDAQPFERLVESVRTITTELLELQACTAQRRGAGLKLPRLLDAAVAGRLALPVPVRAPADRCDDRSSPGLPPLAAPALPVAFGVHRVAVASPTARFCSDSAHNPDPVLASSDNCGPWRTRHQFPFAQRPYRHGCHVGDEKAGCPPEVPGLLSACAC